MVISDVANDTENTGNQFVWIPVINSVSYERNITYEFTFLSEVAYDDTEYLPDGITNEEDAVRSAGGFYVSRYEAGQNGTDTLVSKKGATIWENVSPTTAKTIAKTIFTDNTHVKSALISGIQWDMTMAFISSKPRLDGTNKTYDVTKTDNSRHIGGSSVTIAGDNEADRVCNIYDLEGNAWEYVAEKNTYDTSVPFVGRGGTFGSSNSASYRCSSYGVAFSDGSIRLALYVE